MIDNEVTLSNDEEIAETFNKYFCNIAKNLSLPESPSIKEPSVELFTDPVILALEKYKDHPSITSIKNKMTSMDNSKFSFRFVSLNKTLNVVDKLNRKKASQATDMPVKIIKENKDVIFFYVFHNFSNALSSCSFPTALKYADVTNSTSPVEIQIENTIISSVKTVKLLGVHIDSRLYFDYHVKKLVKKCTLYLGSVNKWIKINGECL